MASEEIFDEASVRKQVATCLPYVERAMREVRTLSYLLHPPMLEEMGLSSAIRWHLEGFSERSGIQTTYEIPDDIRLPRDVELALFRVFQESLTNVHRHSESKTAHVRFALQDATAILEVTDYGKGMPPDLLDSKGDSLGSLGVGVRGMRERVRQLNGTLRITSASQGSTVQATIPIDRASSVVRRTS